jgi:hypothetical protein
MKGVPRFPRRKYKEERKKLRRMKNRLFRNLKRRQKI